MTNKIGFRMDSNDPEYELITSDFALKTPPRKSLVKIKFPGIDNPYTYYNEFFDLNVNDKVMVSGKLESYIGVVKDVIYNFKIDLSKYERVIRKIETHIKGIFYLWDRYMLTFDKNAIPYDKVTTWFDIYTKEGSEILELSDGAEDILNELLEKYKSDDTEAVCSENDVLYIGLQNNQGYAIVKDDYCVRLLEFKYNYKESKISDFYCDCFEPDFCDHQYALLLMLCGLIKLIDDKYSDDFSASKNFAIVKKKLLEAYATDSTFSGKITLE